MVQRILRRAEGPEGGYTAPVVVRYVRHKMTQRHGVSHSVDEHVRDMCVTWRAPIYR